MTDMRLGFTERQLLVLYRKFYGEEYPCDGSADSHAKAQAMCYLLQRAGFFVGEFGFMWDPAIYERADAEAAVQKPSGMDS